MTMSMLNDALVGSGFQVKQCKTKVRVENEDGALVTYHRKVFVAIDAIINRCGGRIGDKDASELKSLYTCESPKPQIECTPELHRDLVKEAIRVWDCIIYDYLAMFPDYQCSAADAREGVGDRMEDRRFYQLSTSDQNAILAEAIPHDQCV